ncbi:hypothetical protein JVU11DRAFT_4880 [Chiua virens]|nr:hypothetical protein JVU11DRAFT_4880 [Chiua virens]
MASGQRRHASSPEALEALGWLFDSASVTSIIILPGSGITISTVPTVCEALLPHGLKEIHLSGGKWIDGHSAYRPDGMGMGEWNIWRTDEAAVRKVRDFVDDFFTMERLNSA